MQTIEIENPELRCWTTCSKCGITPDHCFDCVLIEDHEGPHQCYHCLTEGVRA